MRLADSLWQKALVTIAAAGAFIWVYETRILDSKFVNQGMSDQAGQPRPGVTMPFVTTAYCKGQVTSAGVAAQRGIAAADPTLLPLGSVVQLTSLEARYNGIYTVLDTGSSVLGRAIDLYLWNCNEALKFGRRSATLTVLRLGWNPQATTPSLMRRLFSRPEPPEPPDPLPSRPLPGFQ
jgi:3D (Asp-Asp-Asp) domain-containing protein